LSLCPKHCFDDRVAQFPPLHFVTFDKRQNRIGANRELVTFFSVGLIAWYRRFQWLASPSLNSTAHILVIRGEPPGADPARAFFISLYLLERDAEPAREVALRHAHDQSVIADGLSDLGVRGIRSPHCALHCKKSLPLGDDSRSAILDM
jgi:hypothetical protein